MTPLVYFIRRGATGPIKIGRSVVSAERRLRELQTGSPERLRLMHSFFADDAALVERALHRHFARLRLCGEWFRPHPSLVKLVEQLSRTSPAEWSELLEPLPAVAVSRTWEKITAAGLFPARGLPSDNDLPIDREIASSEKWLRLHGRPTKTIRRRRSSYGYKHDVERWAGSYVSNGAFIEAATRLGYTTVRTDERSPNAYFNLTIGRAPP